jgi:hypothetical protein
MAEAAGARAAILVEGWSDQAALEALARRRGWRLHAEGIVIVPIGGVTNLGKFVQALGPSGLGLRLAGLYDAGEARYVQRTLGRLGPGAALMPAGTEAIGFFACEADLEDELILTRSNACSRTRVPAPPEPSHHRPPLRPSLPARSKHKHTRASHRPERHDSCQDRTRLPRAGRKHRPPRERFT